MKQHISFDEAFEGVGSAVAEAGRFLEGVVVAVDILVEELEVEHPVGEVSDD